MKHCNHLMPTHGILFMKMACSKQHFILADLFGCVFVWTVRVRGGGDGVVWCFFWAELNTELN